MKREILLSPLSLRPSNNTPSDIPDERPWTVRQAAQFLGVSPQTVYLWVERKQIPHLRVMGRNIRFLRSDLNQFRAYFDRSPTRDERSYGQLVWRVLTGERIQNVDHYPYCEFQATVVFLWRLRNSTIIGDMLSVQKLVPIGDGDRGLDGRDDR